MTIAPDTNLAPGALVLVTGATGFVGAYVVRDLLTAGFRVRALRRRPVLPAFIDEDIIRKAEWIDCDIFDISGIEEAMDDVDAIVHSAAVVSFNPSDKELLYKTNVEGTENTVNIALNKGVKRFVHVSSVATLGKKNDNRIVDETSKWQDNKLNTGYAVSKYLGEMHVWRAIAEGLNAVIVNPSTILGYGDWHTSSTALFKKVYDGFPWYSTGSTGFVDVEDVSRAIVTLITTNISAERFILNGDNWTYKRLLDTIADGFRKPRPRREATPVLAEIAWRAEKIRSMFTGEKVLLTRESARIAASSTSFSNNKILNALPGFTFTDLNVSIARACQRYLQQNPAS